MTYSPFSVDLSYDPRVEDPPIRVTPCKHPTLSWLPDETREVPRFCTTCGKALPEDFPDGAGGPAGTTNEGAPIP